MRNYLPPPHKFRPKTLDSTDTVDFTHFRRTVNRYCAKYCITKHGPNTMPRTHTMGAKLNNESTTTEPAAEELGGLHAIYRPEKEQP